jgi:hypothetical protein
MISSTLRYAMKVNLFEIPFQSCMPLFKKFLPLEGNHIAKVLNTYRAHKFWSVNHLSSCSNRFLYCNLTKLIPQLSNHIRQVL